MNLESLPALNAGLNTLSFFLLIAGYIKIRGGHKSQHQKLMESAFFVSVAFLISYLIYHFNVGSVPFQGQGWIRPVYFFILITHIIFAALVPFLALITLYRAWKEQFERHKRIARWTLPIWLYTSITGVLVYLLLYRLYPGS
ncbi:MAG: DUF420 domain-containing protein [bacterium]|nr:DUF420 domain-containing protein [bacterium]